MISVWANIKLPIAISNVLPELLRFLPEVTAVWFESLATLKTHLIALAGTFLMKKQFNLFKLSQTVLFFGLRGNGVRAALWTINNERRRISSIRPALLTNWGFANRSEGWCSNMCNSVQSYMRRDLSLELTGCIDRWALSAFVLLLPCLFLRKLGFSRGFNQKGRLSFNLLFMDLRSSVLG